MVDNIDRRFTLEELSDMFGMPLTSLKSCFKHVFGKPIGLYMRQRRISEASEMLAKTIDPVAEISERVGYESHAKFSSAFKASMGCTPSEYRKSVARKG
jgi:AraC-like DNA-binding protein